MVICIPEYYERDNPLLQFEVRTEDFVIKEISDSLLLRFTSRDRIARVVRRSSRPFHPSHLIHQISFASLELGVHVRNAIDTRTVTSMKLVEAQLSFCERKRNEKKNAQIGENTSTEQSNSKKRCLEALTEYSLSHTWR